MSRTPSYLKSIKRESVVQSVINCLTDAMRAGELKPGDKIPTEPELAESLGVARSSVREAIKILTYMGVLESKRAEGTFICDGYNESMIDPMVYGIILHQDSFENLMDLREMTEVGMIHLAILHHNEKDLDELEDLLSEMKAAMVKKDIEEIFQADNRFHDKIAEMARNPMADKINRVVRSLTYALRFETVSTMVQLGETDKLLDAHQKLLDTMRDGDTDHLFEKVRVTYFEEQLAEQQVDNAV